MLSIITTRRSSLSLRWWKPVPLFVSILAARTDSLSTVWPYSNSNSNSNTKINIAMPPQPLQLPPHHSYWKVCDDCRGDGLLRKSPSRKMRRRAAAGNNNSFVSPRYEPCQTCHRSGIVPCSDSNSSSSSSSSPPPQEGKDNVITVRVAIVGGGVAGLALATACRHRGIPHTVFERDTHFEQRSQGYGLTMQQASKVLADFGILALPDGITSTKHVVHEPNGTVVGQWGMRHWQGSDPTSDNNHQRQHEQEEAQKEENSDGKKKNKKKRQNVHIARQALRHELLQTATASNQKDTPPTIHWNHRLLEYKLKDDNQVELLFETEDETGQTKTVSYMADLVVGADGIRSQVRRQLISEDKTPLRYLDVFVMLGICPLNQDNIPRDHPLLDGQTVFQTADGTTRMYMMPYSSTAYMWQLSFPMLNQDEATELSQKGPKGLLQEALDRCQTWHDPISQILHATPVDLVSGYPVYDRELLSQEHLGDTHGRPITLMGDAAHPMSPYKGQGANQALLDALSLARALYRACCHRNKKDEISDKATVIRMALDEYEPEMLSRSAVKVKGSAEAARFLHTKVALAHGNVTRGAASRLAAGSSNFTSE